MLRKLAEARQLFPAFFKFCVDFFPPFLKTLDMLRQLSAIFLFVLFAMQYKIPRTALLLSKTTPLYQIQIIMNKYVHALFYVWSSREFQHLL
jgi:hypothetical protein